MHMTAVGSFVAVADRPIAGTVVVAAVETAVLDMQRTGRTVVPGIEPVVDMAPLAAGKDSVALVDTAAAEVDMQAVDMQAAAAADTQTAAQTFVVGGKEEVARMPLAELEFAVLRLAARHRKRFVLLQASPGVSVFVSQDRPG